MTAKSDALRRCAIYTRKSTEHGLELEFNSLDAQREACEAYVKSQASEGWRGLPQRYDDPAYSGVHMERPALRRLLKDIDAGLVDVSPSGVRNVNDPRAGNNALRKIKRIGLARALSWSWRLK